jgi:CarboxypepD_reg-like domain/TonB-dependent Receptor Plug Domain
MKQVIATAAFLMMIGFSYGQTAKLKGRVTDAVTNQAIPYANVFIQNTSTGTTTDTAGNFMFDNLNPGFYNIQISFTGYVTKSIFEVEVNNAKMAILDVPLETEVKEINQVVVTGSKTFIKTQESPVSVRSLGLNEIQRYPGGNRDISKVIQSLPGVAPTNNNRNDIIIRGGSPSENKFYVDGIEVPTINHFSTQGASGGPVGLINVDLIKDVDFL